MRHWSDEKGFGSDERRADRSRGGGRLGMIGSEAASSAQLKDMGGGEVVRIGSGIGLECDVVCELVSRVPGELVCMLASTVRGASGVVGSVFGAST